MIEVQKGLWIIEDDDELEFRLALFDATMRWYNGKDDFVKDKSQIV